MLVLIEYLAEKLDRSVVITDKWFMVFTCPEGVHWYILFFCANKWWKLINSLRSIDLLTAGSFTLQLTLYKLSSHWRRFLTLSQNPVCLHRSEQKCFHSLSGTLFRFLRETFSPSCLMHNFLFKNNSKCISRTCLSAGLLKSLLTINLLRNIYLLASRVIDFPFYANNHMANGNYV